MSICDKKMNGAMCACECENVDKVSESTLNDGLKVLVLAILNEARSKHLIDCLHDDYLNDDFHVDVTLTVGEIASAARCLGIDYF